MVEIIRDCVSKFCYYGSNYNTYFMLMESGEELAVDISLDLPIYCREDGIDWLQERITVGFADIPQDELLHHVYSPDVYMCGKTLHIYCVGDGEFEFSCEQIYPDNQLLYKCLIQLSPKRLLS